jgi:small redox-active disulfide protein 2
MKVEVLGTGCAKCRKLFEILNRAVRETGLSAEVGKVEDIVEIMRYNVMQLPAVAIDGKVALAGRIPALGEAKDLLLAVSKGSGRGSGGQP